MSFELKPHQIRCIEAYENLRRTARQFRRCITSATGTGKSAILTEIAKREVARGGQFALYSIRRLLTDQFIRQLHRDGIPFGCRAAEFDEHIDDDAPVQICSMQTEQARVIKKRLKNKMEGDIGRRQFPLARATLVGIDEAHLLGGAVAQEIVDEHYDLGASVIGFSATPFGCGHLFDSGGLIFGADVSEGRKSGLLVPCYVKGCPEMDTSQIEKVKTSNGDWSENDIRKYCWTQAIYGYVFESMVEFNPMMKPFFLFAPGVEESVGFEAHFRKHGVRIAHIDATDVVLDGVRYPSNRDVRNSVLREHESGDIKGITNRWVLREALDAPWVEFLSLATPFGSLTTYLQVAGRVLRASPSTGKKFASILDHGGNAWRFGSPNADRHHLFAEYFDDPDGARLAKETRLEDIRQEKEECPVTCPKCGSVQILMKTGKCYNCEHDLRGKQQRFVIQRDGKLIELTGLPVKPRREVRTQDMVRAWTSAYWAAKRPGSKLHGYTFAQLRGMIASGHFRGFEKLRGQWPGRGLPFTPMSSTDWFRSVSDVPAMSLHGNG